MPDSTIALTFRMGWLNWSLPLTPEESFGLRGRITKCDPATTSEFLKTIRDWLPSAAVRRALKSLMMERGLLLNLVPGLELPAQMRRHLTGFDITASGATMSLHE